MEGSSRLSRLLVVGVGVVEEVEDVEVEEVEEVRVGLVGVSLMFIYVCVCVCVCKENLGDRVGVKRTVIPYVKDRCC